MTRPTRKESGHAPASGPRTPSQGPVDQRNGRGTLRFARITPEPSSQFPASEPDRARCRPLQYRRYSYARRLTLSSWIVLPGQGDAPSPHEGIHGNDGENLLGVLEEGNAVMEPEIDEQGAKEFARKLLNIYTGCALTKLIDVGHQTGLFDAASKRPSTSHELAERAGLHERYVREWLGAMTTGGIFIYDPASRTYTLPSEHASLLCGDTARNLAPMSQMLNVFGRNLPQLVECFRSGGGIPYSEFRGFVRSMEDVWRRIYDQHLITGFLPAAVGLPQRLQAGIRVADIGCGAGHAVNVMAREYPHSTFVGFDLSIEAIERAEAEARDMGLTNARFEVLDIAQLPPAPPFDLIVAFDAIHDQVAPAIVLQRVSDALAPDGTFLMIDFKFSSNVEENIGNPFAPLYYGISVMHCMTVSLAEGGAGFRNDVGHPARAAHAGRRGPHPRRGRGFPPTQNCIFICRKEGRSDTARKQE